MSLPSHIVTLSFDDGFRRSSLRTAEIFEAHGLRATINVVAAWSQGTDTFGTWDDWNHLQARGHEIGVHTWDHTNLAEVPLADARSHIDKCLRDFDEHLDGFEAQKAVYNFAYNASTPEVETYVLERCRALRTGGDDPVNSLGARRITCWSDGPGNCDAFLTRLVDRFLVSSGGWLVFNAHGLDDEGWGPLSNACLDRLLAELTRQENVAVLTTAAALDLTS